MLAAGAALTGGAMPLSAQSLLSQFSYENLKPSAVQFDVGPLAGNNIRGALTGGLRLDYGFIAPHVRVLLGLSYFKADFSSAALARFARQLDSIVNPGTNDRRAPPQRQRIGDQRDVRRRCARRDHRRVERHAGGGDRRAALALHAGGPRRTVERALDGVAPHGGHVPLGGAEEVSDPVRVAVIGAGAIAQVAHLPVLRRLPGVEVAAICDSDLSKAQALAGRFDVRETFDDIEEVSGLSRSRSPGWSGCSRPARSTASG